MTQTSMADLLQEAGNPDLRDAELWAQCFVEADGDESKSKAIYVKRKMPKSTTPADTRPGWCPNCGAQCLLSDNFCNKCNTNMTGFYRPRSEKPTPRPSTSSSETQIVKTTKSRGVYIILGLIFGLLGFHNFYIGRFQRGAFQLLCTVILGWFVVGLVITTVWVLIDLFTVTQDGHGDPLN